MADGNKRCPKCGNVIQPWQNGVCFVCVNMQVAAKKFGGNVPAPLWPKKPPPAPPPMPPIPKPNAAPAWKAKAKPGATPAQKTKTKSGTTQTKKAKAKPKVPLGLRQRVLGYNELLKEIYGKPIRFSTILKKYGYTDMDIQQLKQSPTKLQDFLDQMSLFISQSLTAKGNLNAFSVLDAWYGLEYAKTRTLQDIATTTGLQVNQIQVSHKKSIKLLQNLVQNNNFETHVCMTFSIIF